MKTGFLFVFVFFSLCLMEQATGQVTKGAAFGKSKTTMTGAGLSTSYEDNSKMFTEKLKKMITPTLSKKQEKKIYQAYLDCYKANKIYFDRQRE